MAALSFSIVRDEFPDHAIPRTISKLSPLLALGSLAGLPLAGPIEELSGLDWLFWLPMIVVGAATLAAHLWIPESPVGAAGRINWPAALLLSGWLVGLLLGVSRAPAWGWTSPAVLVLLAGAAVLAALWVVVELRSRQPLVDPRLLRVRAVRAAYLVALLVGFGIFAAIAHVPQFLQAPPGSGYGFGATSSEAGLMLVPQSVCSFLLGLVTGWPVVRFGFRRVLLVGTLATAAGYAIVALAHDHVWQLLLALAFMGAGLGVSQAALANVVVAAVPREQTGVASGTYATIRTIGGSIGTAVIATGITASAGPGGLPTVDGYTAGFLLLTTVALLAAVATLFLPGVREERTDTGEAAGATAIPTARWVRDHAQLPRPCVMRAAAAAD